MKRGAGSGGRADAHHKPARSKRALTVEAVRIESLAAGGAGVGRLDNGAAVFVPGAARGEDVEIEVDRDARPARGRLVRVLAPSPDRVEPACAHVALCGGCDFMHLSQRAQEEAHAEIVRSAITHATGSPPPPVRVHAAPASLGYRTRARLFARSERGRMRVGYRAAGSHALAAVETCVVLAPSIAVVLAEIPSLLEGSSGEGDVQITSGAGGRPCLDVVWRGELAPSAWAALDRRIAEGGLAGARVLLEGAKTPALFGDPRPVLEGPDGAPLVIAPGSFAQASDAGAALLARRVVELARRDPEAQAGAEGSHVGSVVELFAGSGTLSVLLARVASGFVSVESDEESVRAAKENLAARGLSGKITVADADTFVLPRADVVVLDPPRPGAPGASRAIVASRIDRVVYVACDPATLARDLGTLVRGGFSLTHLETVELFPQTSHVETVARLVRRRGAP
jgi:23S rRNA (uracil1939-C5)-methyltransferase